MTTISVTLTSKHLRYLDNLVVDGVGKNRADVMRLALERLVAEEAIVAMLEMQTDGSIGGDLRELFESD
jgi:Arc/MetJ-type ribon-helix-helix transcriptional regulator